MSDTARVFMNGRSQAVRLPTAYRFKGREVLIERRGGAVILREKTETLGDALREFYASTEPVPEDFLKHRKNGLPQSRIRPKEAIPALCRAEFKVVSFNDAAGAHDHVHGTRNIPRRPHHYRS